MHSLSLCSDKKNPQVFFVFVWIMLRAASVPMHGLDSVYIKPAKRFLVTEGRLKTAAPVLLQTCLLKAKKWIAVSSPQSNMNMDCPTKNVNSAGGDNIFLVVKWSICATWSLGKYWGQTPFISQHEMSSSCWSRAGNRRNSSSLHTPGLVLLLDLGGETVFFMFW